MPTPTSEQDAIPGEVVYASQLRAHLPSGEAWACGPDSNFWRLLRGMAVELARAHGRAADFYREIDPRSTTELIGDWEEFLGLPDECTGPLSDIVLRRGAVVSKFLEQGGQSPSDFVELAAEFGYEIEIVEHRPFRVGSSVVGDALENDGDPFVIGDTVGEALGAILGWSFYWDVVTTEFTVHQFVAGSSVGEPLASWNQTLLECVIRDAAPAHTVPRFIYVAEPTEPEEPPPVPEGMLPELEPMTDDVITSSWDLNTGLRVSVGPESTWHPFAAGSAPVPTLLNLGEIEWLVTGEFYKGAGTNTLSFELVVDGTPTGAVLNFPTTGTSGVHGKLKLKAWLSVIGNPNGTTSYDFDGHLRMKDETGALMFEGRASAVPVIDPNANHSLALRYKQTGVLGDAFFLFNVMGKWIHKQKGL